MKKATVKNYLLTYTQLPVVAAPFVVVCIERVLMWCLAYLSNPLSSPSVKLGGKSHTDDRTTERNSQHNIRERIRRYSLLNRN